MNRFSLCNRSSVVWSLSVVALLGVATLQAQSPPALPKTASGDTKPTAPTTAPATPTPTSPAAAPPAGSAAPTPAPAKPTVVGDGQVEADGKEPKAATVKETQPTTPPSKPTPAPETPALSGPAPSPEVLPVLPKTRYFVLVFGSESRPKRGRWTHTWATVVKATPKPNLVDPYDPEGDQTKYYDLLAHTISWMPASLSIRVLKLRAECGVNLDLHTSLRYTLGHGECVALWGPYEVNPTVAAGFYNKFLAQIAKLKSGRVLYKSLDPDSGPQAGWVVDCIHAVSDLDGVQRRLRYDEFQHNGWDGSRVIVRSLVSANRVDPNVTHKWIEDALNLGCYRISHQTMAVCRPPMLTTAVPTAVPTPQ
jgi:hypothetical protein